MHAKTAMEVRRSMAGRLLRSANGVNNVTWKCELILGTIPANGASHVTQPKRPVPNGQQRGPYSLTCRYTTYCGYIVVGSFARRQRNTYDNCSKCEGKIERKKLK